MSSSSSSSSSGEEDLFSYEGAKSLEVDLWEECGSGGDEEEEGMSSEERDIDMELTLLTVKKIGKKRRRDSVDADEDDGRRSKRRKRNEPTRKEKIKEIRRQRKEERKKRDSQSASQSLSPLGTPLTVHQIDEDEDDDDLQFVDVGYIMRRSSHCKSSESLRKIQELKWEERMQERKDRKKSIARPKALVKELDEEDILLDDEADTVSIKRIINLKIEGEDEPLVINVNIRRNVAFIKKKVIEMMEWDINVNEVSLKRKGEILHESTALNTLADLQNNEEFELIVPQRVLVKPPQEWTLKFGFRGDRHPIELQIDPELTFKQVRALVAKEKECDEKSVIMTFDGDAIPLNEKVNNSEIEDDDLIECKLK